MGADAYTHKCPSHLTSLDLPLFVCLLTPRLSVIQSLSLGLFLLSKKTVKQQDVSRRVPRFSSSHALLSHTQETTKEAERHKSVLSLLLSSITAASTKSVLETK